MRGWLRALVRALAEDDLTVYAASIAYAGVLSVFPLLVGVIALLSLVVDQSRAQDAALRALQPYLPHPALEAVQSAIASVVRTRSAAGSLAVVGVLWATTAAAGALRHALSKILRVGRHRVFWRRKLVEMALVALAGTFLGLSALLPAAVAALRSLPGLGPAAAEVGRSPAVRELATLAPWVLAAGAFFVVYRFLPPVRPRRRGLLAGTATAAVLFELTRRAFFWYVSTLASYPLVYGPLAGVVVFMVWAYLVALLTLVGAEVMRVAEGKA
ncbi:MAG: YihY/virulence factor BrkB family protein [Armatimonadota bacterium]|nr:YihY/virulence factor BrkB family protein [Armatimonadota bacterium]MDR7401941.1 YihY/virulence factor BrkB family protein [Armatimonadota bacterium]MDR7403678.1 YihY/virulence factor BrkB family protein [Armatimonadota bacterium]MDR7437287.1 YihY/virulence factor BrkB family protein [Armatimonadota bacterium]MDR7471508.1 YihY/virulence factor BrkB family protein [Armatimonadota bacterium]